MTAVARTTTVEKRAPIAAELESGADENTRYLVTYGRETNYSDLPATVVKRTKLLLIDTLGVAISGYTGQPGKIARRLAEEVMPRGRGATLIGSGVITTLEMATFANGVMMRDPEFNDTLINGSRGHPSDNFAPLLACGEFLRSSGKDFIVASVIAYEVVGQLARAVRQASPEGIDHAFSQCVSAACGAAKLFDLDAAKWAQAVNMAVASNIALYQARCGELSMWKSGAVPNACRNGVFSVLLAREGFTGPAPIFEGRGGLFKAITGPFELKDFGGDGRPYEMTRTAIKRFPVNIAIQSPVQAGLRLRERIPADATIEEILMETWDANARRIASDREVYRPGTRDTADHSAPYALAVALMHGRVEAEHFEEASHRRDPKLLDLVSKVRVVGTAEFNPMYPEHLPTRITVTTSDGQTYSETVVDWRGHWADPFDERDVEEKFNRITKGRLSAAQRARVLERVWDLEELDDVGELLPLLKI